MKSVPLLLTRIRAPVNIKPLSFLFGFHAPIDPSPKFYSMILLQGQACGFPTAQRNHDHRDALRQMDFLQPME